MRRTGVIVAILSLSLGTAVPAFAATGKGAHKVAHKGTHVVAKAARPAHKPKLSMEDARKLALAKVPGKIHAEELEKEGGKWIYSFEIEETGGKADEIKEVNVDADTGNIGPVETEKKRAKGDKAEKGEAEKGEAGEGAEGAEDKD